MIERVETWTDHGILGDMHVEVTYSNYKDCGVKVPTKIVQKRGGFTFFETTVADAKSNPPDLAALLTPPARGGGPGGAPGGAAAGGPRGGGAPGAAGAAGAAPGGARGGGAPGAPGAPGAQAGAAGPRAGGQGAPGAGAPGAGAPGGRGAGAPGAGAPPAGGPPAGAQAGAPGAPRAGGPGGAPAAPQIGSTKLAEGVYLITAPYNALAVEFKDYIAVVEAGQSVANGQNVLNEVKKVYPNKPIRYIINSHPHEDHSLGLAPFVAEGATIVTYKNNKKFFETAYSTPRTLLSDSLAQNKRKPKVMGIGEKQVFKDDNHSLELHHIIDKDIEKVHSDGIIVAYLPKEKILFQADFTLPAAGAMPNPFVQSLGENMGKLKLDFDRYLSVHPSQTPQTRQDLMNATGVKY
jgi:glyoxylase-like metal-dependent hydrolase (beta-lactamase superfamily II)